MPARNVRHSLHEPAVPARELLEAHFDLKFFATYALSAARSASDTSVLRNGAISSTPCRTNADTAWGERSLLSSSTAGVFPPYLNCRDCVPGCPGPGA